MAVAGRSISMFSLITDGILEPGDGVLTFDYLGKRFTADLLPEGTIRFEDQIFASPYAWASLCKNEMNPEQKTAIGWGHIRYKGIKLSQYKNIYLKKNKLISEDMDNGSSHVHSSRRGRKKKILMEGARLKEDISGGVTGVDVLEVAQQSMVSEPVHQQAALSQTSELVECQSFENSQERQPFVVEISSNVLLVMDFHSHMCWSEMMGYLGGHYNPDTHIMQIAQAFPCQFEENSSGQTEPIEQKVREDMTGMGLRPVGWYHSHPSCAAMPTHNDVVQHAAYQQGMRLPNGDEPCVGMIISPNLANRTSGIQSNMTMFWLQRNEGQVIPYVLQYTIAWEQFLTQNVVDEMNTLAAYYRHRQDTVNFKSQWREGIPFIHKLKTSLANVQPKFPQENSDETFFTFIRQLTFQGQA